MKEFYNSHVRKFRDIHWERDHRQLTSALASCRGRKVILRIEQTSGKKQVIRPEGTSLQNLIQNAGINLSETFKAELIIRNPASDHSEREPHEAGHRFRDQNDFNSLQTVGERSADTVQEHPVRDVPMFYRNNGTNIDLVDMYRGASIFLILNGPSFADVDHSQLKQPGILTFATNNGAHLFRPNLWTCVDDPTRFLESIWSDPAITKFVPMAHFQKPIWNLEEGGVDERRVADFPNVIGFRRNEQFHASKWLYEDTINWGNHKSRGGGRSVMLSALRICYLLGFRKVFLLGCDFRMDQDRRYWFPEKRTDHAIRNNMNSYDIMRTYFRELLPYFEREKFQVINCTEGSDLDVFPKEPLEDAIRRTLVSTSPSTEGMYVDRFKK